jgi:hypothetical protein
VVEAGGLTRGFVSFHGGTCAALGSIWYFQGSGGTWTRAQSTLRGRVLGAADDGSSTFLLYQSSTGVWIAKRPHTGGLVNVQRLSTATQGGGALTSWDLVAFTDQWWAVWTEQVGPGGEFAQTELFQAKTYGAPDLPRTQVTNHPDNDHQPALAFKPGGGSELVFVRDDAFGGGPTYSHVRLATASGNSGVWAGRQFAVIGLNYGPSIDTTPGPGGHTYVAWIRNQQPFESDDRSGGFLPRAFVGSSFTTDVDASGGQVHVAWPESGAGTVLAERSAGGTWTKATVSTVESRLNPAVVSRSGRGTVLMASSTRVYARTQVP